MFSCTCLPVSFSSSPRMRSASAPRRPMTMPGRAVWMSTRTRSRVRSISTLAMPARSMPLLMSLRIATSSLTYSAYCLSANQRLLKSVVMPRRKPCGLTFCPISAAPSLLVLDAFDLDGDVARALADAVGATLRPRLEPLERRALVDIRTRHDQRLRVGLEVVLGVGDRARKDLGDRLTRGLRCELQHRQRLVGGQVADQVDDAACLHRRDSHARRPRERGTNLFGLSHFSLASTGGRP